MQNLRHILLITVLSILFVGTACAQVPPAPSETPTDAVVALATTPTLDSATPTATTVPSVTPTIGLIPYDVPLATDTPTSTPTLTPVPPTRASTAVPSITDLPIPTRVSGNLPTISLSGCATIWEPGIYKLTNDIKTPEYDCFYIQGHDIVLDCDNHTIEGNNYQGYAVFVRKYGFPFQQTPANIEIRNCKALHHRTGVFVGGANNVYVHHNDLSDNLDTVDKARFGIFLGMTEGGGLRFDSVKVGRAEYNTTNREAIGIDIRDSERVTVKNNSAASNSAWGISLLNTTYSQVSNNTVKDNIRYCAWGDGTVGRGCDAGGIILQDGASHNTVSGNSIVGENGNGVFIKSHASRCGNDNLIENNTITDAVYNAVEFSFCSGNRVIGNTIAGSYDAVWFGFSTKTEVRGNTIKNMNNHGIISYNSRDSLIAENKVINSREGIYFYWDTWDPKRFFFLTPTADNYASRNNTIRDNYLSQNSVAAIHLLNSIQDQLINNTFDNNGKTVWVEGKTDSVGAGSGQ